MKFPDFNALLNTENTACYMAMYGGSQELCTYDEVVELARTQPDLIIGWLVQKNYLAIETTDALAVRTLAKYRERCIIIQNGPSYMVLCKSTFEYSTLNNALVCGAHANTYAHDPKGTTYIMLPFYNKAISTMASTLSKVKIIYSNGVGFPPYWFSPLYKESSAKQIGIPLPITTNQETVLFNILTLIVSKVPEVEISKLIHFINTEFVSPPITKPEVNNLLISYDKYLIRTFFEKDTFMHHKVGDYLVETLNIKRDYHSRDLFFYNSAKGIYIMDNDYLLNYLTKLCPVLKAFQKEEVMKYIYQSLYDESTRFNDDPFSIVFKNGVLDIRTMRMMPMSPDKLESIQLGCAYNPKATSKIADEFFETLTNGDKDIETLLYEAIGYSMLKTSELQTAFMLVGQGRNGKSTYLDLIRAILGEDNTTSVSFKDLNNTFRASQLKNKLASLAGDVSSQPITDSDMIKAISSGDKILVEEKYKNATNERLFATLFFACNKLPRTPDNSEGFRRRFIIVPMIANLSKITHVDGMIFKSHLLAPAGLEYVAAKAVKAIHDVLLVKKMFTIPAAAKHIMEEYKVDNSAVLSWFKDIHRNNAKKVAALTLTVAYVSYTNWCISSGRKQLNQTSFKQAVKTEIGIELE